MYRLLKETKHYLFFFIISLLLAYIIGLTIVSVINNRLSELSINIPAPKVDFRLPEPAPEDLKSQPGSVTEGFHVIKPGYQPIDPKKNVMQDDNIRGFQCQKGYADCQEAVSQIEMERQCQMNKVCCMKHNHFKYVCDYGKTNYLNPMELDPVNRKIFKHNYFPNMTLQDYVNWLWLHEGDESKLCYEHLKNFEKLKQGKPLRYQKGICPPGLNATGVNCGDPLKDSGSYFQNVISAMGLDVGNAPKGYNLT